MARTYVLRNLTDDKGRPLSNVWTRAFNATTSALAETQYTDNTGTCTFTTLPDDANVNICAVWGDNAKWFYNIYQATQDMLYLSVTDAVITTCSITKLTAGNLTVAGIVGTGGSLGTAASGARVEITPTGIKGYDATTQRIQILNDGSGWFGSSTAFAWTTAGVLTMTAGSSGMKISSTGINLWGLNNALTTRATETGTIQCSVNSSGQITAGAGAILIDAAGIKIAGNYLLIQYPAGTTVGGMYGESSMLRLQATSGNATTVGGNTACYVGATGSVLDFTNDLMRPDTNGDISLGSSSYRWNGMYGNPVLDATSAAVQGGLSCSGASNGILYVYAGGAWRINNV